MIRRCFGAQPNSTANFGQAVVLSSASVTNNGSPVASDDFLADASLDTETWSALSGDPTSVQLVPQDAGSWWVKWSLPDAGFGLQTTTNLTDANSWVTLTGPNASGPPLASFASSGSRFVLVPSSSLGSQNRSYFRLLQQISGF